MSDYQRFNARDLDNYITGHFGEDQLRESDPDDFDDDDSDLDPDRTPLADPDRDHTGGGPVGKATERVSRSDVIRELRECVESETWRDR